MTLSLKQKIHHETDMPIPRCWVTECKYTVARTGPDSEPMYQITAPGDRAPFAYTPVKAEVRKIIINHKQANQ